MRTSHAIALSLFDLLDLDVALAGDLLEERERGCSAIWYWRQVLVALWIGIWGAVRDHKVLALRAVATGFAMEYLVGVLWANLSHLLPSRPMLSMSQWIMHLSLALLTQTATGWVVARTHRARQVPMVLVFLIFFSIWNVWGSWDWVRMVLVDSIDQPRFRPYFAQYLITLFMMIVGILLGCMLARRREDRHENISRDRSLSF